MYLLSKFGGTGYTNSYLNYYINTSKKANSPPRYAILKDFQNQENRFTIPKFKTRLGKKRKGRMFLCLQAITKRYYAFHVNTKMLLVQS